MKTTLPEPWLSLSQKLGSVKALAQALGTVPKTVSQWAHGTRKPRGSAMLLIDQVFHKHGIKQPFS